MGRLPPAARFHQGDRRVYRRSFRPARPARALEQPASLSPRREQHAESGDPATAGCSMPARRSSSSIPARTSSRRRSSSARVEVMTANRDWLARRGIAFIITIAPDKSTIYPEKLPTYPRPPGRTTRADQLVARLRDRPRPRRSPRGPARGEAQLPEALFRGRQPLDAARSLHRLFAADGSGAGKIPERRARVPRRLRYRLGSGGRERPCLPARAARRLALHRRTLHPAVHASARHDGANPTPGGWGWPIKFIETDLKAQPRLLVLGDSFTDYVLGPTFLFESFRDPVFTHHNGGTFNFTLVDEVKPDLVIFALAERYIALPPQVPLG